jgi:hypothetical protein
MVCRRGNRALLLGEGLARQVSVVEAPARLRS